jgi:ectoine hydroxylase-related dioxygenase (phytanoyl-CoA dioxygenase family)
MPYSRPVLTVHDDATAQAAAFFHEHGWARVDALLPREQALALHSHIAGLSPSGSNAAGELGATQAGYVASDDFERRHRLIPEPQLMSEEVRRACFDPRLAAAARALLGVETVRFFHAKVMEKPPQRHGGLETKLHQDYPTMPIDRSGQVVFWIALTDLAPETGTLQFVSGSHRFGPLGRDPFVRPDHDALGARARREGWMLSEAPHLAAGDATAHLDLTVHAAGANHGREPRWGLSVGYIDADCLYTGMPCRTTDGLGLEVNRTFDHERFPVIA